MTSKSSAISAIVNLFRFRDLIIPKCFSSSLPSNLPSNLSFLVRVVHRFCHRMFLIQLVEIIQNLKNKNSIAKKLMSFNKKNHQ